MKKLILILTLTFSFTSQAQKEANWGIRAGVNYSTISIGSSNQINRYEFNYKKGLYIGAILNIQYSDSYAFQPEITYSNQGGKAKSSENKDENIHYLSLAATNKFFIKKDKRFHILIGANVDFNLRDNMIENKSAYGEDSNNDNITAIDFALFTGLGYQFDSGLTLEARYKYGFLAVFSDEIFENIINRREGSRNSLFQFGMAYTFDLKKKSKKIVK
ncbi:MAG: PorT family protein [Flavobacteriaceae bacterium]|nr:PorT family protein [Flavobacteriaceae bacterium]